MQQSYSVPPFIWPSVLTVVLLLALFAYVWPRRKLPGAQIFAVSILFGLFWAAGSVGEYAAVDTAAKIFWNKFQAIWQLPASTAVTCFLLEYTCPGRWLTRRNVALISIVPAAAVILIATNDLHHWFWLGFRVNGSVLPLQGSAAQAFVAYGLGMVVVNFVALGWLFLRSPQHRWAVVVIMIGQIGMRTLYLLEKIGAFRSDLPLDIFGIAFVDLMYTAALFGFRILDPIPLAQQAAIGQMQSGMLVLDARGRVVSLNPYAERMLGSASRQAKGKPVHAVLPTCPDSIRLAPGGTELEISLPKDGIRHCLLTVSPLIDFRGVEVGRLLLLHDVTEQKQAQAQIIEQQRSLAILQEREQLARELHDSTAQVLGYASFQLEVVQHAVQNGQAVVSAGQPGDAISQLEEAEAQLERLINIVADAHADLREDILNLRLAPSKRQPFFATLSHYLDAFCQNYGIRTELTVESRIDEGTFDPDARLQLFRIIQETLSNARRHSGANCVQVAFETQDHQVQVRIRDNGRGFDPKMVSGDRERHFGLQFMRERADQMGGNLRIESSPANGTCVILGLPVNRQRGHLQEVP